MRKSALTIQLLQKIFVPDYNPTIQDAFLKHTNIDNQWAILDVLDTAQQEEFSTFRDGWRGTLGSTAELQHGPPRLCKTCLELIEQESHERERGMMGVQS